MEKNKFKKIKLLIIVAALAVMAYILCWRFKYTDNERIIEHYKKNEMSFILLKDQVLMTINRFPEEISKTKFDSLNDIYLGNKDWENNIRLREKSGFLYKTVKKNHLIDSLQVKLKVVEINTSSDTNYNIRIYMYVDFIDYIGTVEYCFYEDEIKEFSDRDGFGLIKINKNWGFMGYR